MKKLDFNRTKTKIILISAIIAVIALILVFLYFHTKRIKEKENSLFNISEIIVYSSATAVNNVDSPSLTNLSICQFSDLSIRINNHSNDSEYTKYNTIKKLSIDHISISNQSATGRQLLNYKNPYSFGKYEDIHSLENNKIDFRSIYSNIENTTAIYSSPSFYTDCSNPISLGYVNDHIAPVYSISDNNTTVSYNAKLLKDVGVKLEDINATINFTIHITNNANHKLSCNMSIPLTFDEEFFEKGYSYFSLPIEEHQYQFLRD